MSEWAQVYPKSAPVAAEVELFGGPRDGEVRAVADADLPLMFFARVRPSTEPGGRGEHEFVDAETPAAAGLATIDAERHIYCRRTDWPLDAGGVVPFDYRWPERTAV